MGSSTKENAMLPQMFTNCYFTDSMGYNNIDGVNTIWNNPENEHFKQFESVAVVDINKATEEVVLRKDNGHIYGWTSIHNTTLMFR